MGKRTKLPQKKTLEELINCVKVFFKEYDIANSGLVAIAMEEDDFYCVQLQVDADGNLYKTLINYQEEDDSPEQYRTKVLDPDKESMNRYFYDKDKLTVREWFYDNKLEHTLIPESYYPYT